MWLSGLMAASGSVCTVAPCWLMWRTDRGWLILEIQAWLFLVEVALEKTKAVVSLCGLLFNGILGPDLWPLGLCDPLLVAKGRSGERRHAN